MPRRRRRFHRARRVGRRVRRGFRHVKRMSMTTKLIHAGLTALAVSPRIEDGISVAQGQLNASDFARRALNDYTGFDVDGSFHGERLARGYGPLVAAVALGKVIGYARRHWRF